MTPFWIQVAQSLIMAVALILLWGVKTAISGGQWFAHTTDKEAQQDRQLADLKERMDQAGEKVSALATIVQGWLERARKEFMPLDDAQVNWERYREDYKALEQRLREVELIVAREQQSWQNPRHD